MSTFVLIHGSWHGGWCWERVAPLLATRGHHVLAPDLPGMGDDRTPLAEDVAEQWTSWGERLVRAQLEPVILVGHSAGGDLVCRIAERAFDRIARAVFIAGALLPDSKSRYDIKFGSPELYAAVLMSEDGGSYKIDPHRAAALLYTQLPATIAAQAITRLVREPVQPAVTPVRLSADRFGRVRLGYIECAEDRTILLEQQRDMQKAWLCSDVATLPSDHVPLFSMPERLADVLAGWA